MRERSFYALEVTMHLSRLLLILCLQLTAATLPAAQPNRYQFHHENVLGTSLEVQVIAESEAAASQAEARVLSEINRLARIYSTWDQSSELSRWMQSSSSTVVSADLQQLFAASDRWQQQSQGVFQPGVASLTAAWKHASGQGRLPTEAELARAVSEANQTHWQCNGTSIVRASSTPLTFDGIAKGMILDRACEVALTDAGVRGAMVNIGGDVRVAGAMVQEVSIADPRLDAENARMVTQVVVTNRGVATSGNYRRGFEIAGQHYSHILDPRTGRPADNIISATVVAATMTDADALATICSVLTPQESLALVNELEQVECLLIDRDGQQFSSRGWSNLVVTPEVASTSGNADAVGFDAACNDDKPTGGAAGGMELVVDFELTRGSGGAQYRRPYVAIWLEDSENFPVKTAILWMQTTQPGPRWHRDLLRWFRHDKQRLVVTGTPLIGTISGATRGPGEYKAVFDGTDDAGKALKPGKYTLFIEVAREHGTYQLIRQQVILGAGPIAKTELKSNVEISAASIEYRPRSEKPTSTNGN